MFPALKKSLVPLAVLAVVVASAVAVQPRPSEAVLSGGAWFLDGYTPGTADTCAEGDPREIRVFDPGDPDNLQSMITAADGVGDQDPVVQIDADDDLVICVEPTEGGGPVVFNTSGDAEWSAARCGDLATECTNEDGVGTDDMTVPDTNVVSLIAVTFDCDAAGNKSVSILQDDSDDEFSFIVMCKGEADSIQLTATPATVESAPARFNVSHSLIRAVVTDAAGNPVLPGTDADVSSSCGVSTEEVDTLDERAEALFNEGTGVHDGLSLTSINAEFGEAPLKNYLDIQAFSDRAETTTDEVSSALLEVDTNAFPDDIDGGNGDGVPNHSELLVIFHAEGCEPGVHTVTVEVDGEEASVDITVIGPPAFMTMTAAPTELVCGEKSEITISVTDVLNQAVSDNTQIEVLTNYGGVLAGTGTSLTSPQPVNPLSSTTVEIFDGLGTTYLLTSPEHTGPYEVLAASTPSQLGTGIQDSVPVSAQVTVTCTLAGAAPNVTAPDTGTGTIRPPNTGDAGLASDDGNGTLIAAGAAALGALALIARRRLARD